VIEVVVIPADPADPIRVDSMHPDDLAGFRRRVGADIKLVYVDENLYLFTAVGERPVNPRACVLAAVVDPDLTRTVLRGNVVVLGPSDAESVTSAPKWLRDLCARPGPFQIVWLGHNTTETLPLTVPDPFLGLALIVGMTRRAPDRKFLLTRLDDDPTPKAGP
jgi:hypothetical protein